MIVVDERLADRIALIVMPTAGENEQLGFQIRQHGARTGRKTCPASNCADAAAIRVRLSPSGLTAMIPEILAFNSCTSIIPAPAVPFMF
jgi:hypothetical protein